MIVELVRFRNPPGLTREQLLDGARHALPRWQANAALVSKHFTCSPDRREGMGIYVWPTVADARAGHGAEWIAQAEARTGGKVEISYHDLLMTLDKVSGQVSEPPCSPDLPA